MTHASSGPLAEHFAGRIEILRRADPIAGSEAELRRRVEASRIATA